MGELGHWQRACPECGAAFTPTPATRAHAFCSDTCRDLYIYKALAKQSETVLGGQR